MKLREVACARGAVDTEAAIVNRRSGVRQPNILFILADDMGWGDVSYHDSPIRTPNIDRLVGDGIELDQHYVCPMCTPTRASLLTGRHPGRFGAHATVPTNEPVLPNGYTTLATALRSGGYDTGLFGKWHLGSSLPFSPNHYGFNTAYGSLAGGVDPYNHRYKEGEFSVTWHRNGEFVEEAGHATDLIAGEALQWLEGRQRPWFCYVPFTAVHVPVKAPQPWLDQYAGETLDDDPLKDRSFKRYAAYASQMDHAVGQLVEALEYTGQREETIIVFSSDNGAIEDYPLHRTDVYPGWQEDSPRLGSNKPLRGVKAQLYEGGVRTPTVISWRGTLQPGKMEHPVQITDWMPTFTSLTGCAPEGDPCWDGVDIWPLIAGEIDRPDERALSWNFRGGAMRGARYGDWKLICSQGKGEREIELYNIAEDPQETKELAGRHAGMVDQLLEVVAEQIRLDDSAKRDDVESVRVS